MLATDATVVCAARPHSHLGSGFLGLGNEVPVNTGRGFFSSIPGFHRLNSAASEKMDNIIEARELQIERKHFYVELRENDRGKFLRITEEAHGRRNSIIVPSTGVDDFTATIAEVLTNGESCASLTAELLILFL